MLDRNSILYAIYNGETNVSELQREKSTEESADKKKADIMYEFLQAQLTTEQQKLLDDLLMQRILVDCFYEEDKFRQGFVLGMKLMLETLQDKTFDN